MKLPTSYIGDGPPDFPFAIHRQGRPPKDVITKDRASNWPPTRTVCFATAGYWHPEQSLKDSSYFSWRWFPGDYGKRTLVLAFMDPKRNSASSGLPPRQIILHAKEKSPDIFTSAEIMYLGHAIPLAELPNIPPTLYPPGGAEDHVLIRTCHDLLDLLDKCGRWNHCQGVSDDDIVKAVSAQPLLLLSPFPFKDAKKLHRLGDVCNMPFAFRQAVIPKTIRAAPCTHVADTVGSMHCASCYSLARTLRWRVDQVDELVARTVDGNVHMVTHDMTLLDFIQYAQPDLYDELSKLPFLVEFIKAIGTRVAAPGGGRGIPWSDTIRGGALALYCISRSAYLTLLSFGFPLPSPKVLDGDIKEFSSPPGITANSVMRLLALLDMELDKLRAEFSDVPEVELHRFSRCGLLAIDEVHLNAELLTSAAHEIKGAVNLGPILTPSLGVSTKTEQDEVPLAKSALQVMFVSLSTNVVWPLGYFQTQDLKTNGLVSILETLFIEAGGGEFDVMCLALDGSSINRSASNFYDEKGIEHPLYPGQCVRILQDLPHAMKKCRNSLLNCHDHFEFGKLKMGWSVLHELYDYIKAEKSTLDILPKFGPQHLNVDTWAKMRVPLAARVMSPDVAKQLEDELFAKGRPLAAGTATFIRHVHTFYSMFTDRLPLIDPAHDTLSARAAWARDQRAAVASACVHDLAGDNDGPHAERILADLAELVDWFTKWKEEADGKKKVARAHVKRLIRSGGTTAELEAAKRHRDALKKVFPPEQTFDDICKAISTFSTVCCNLWAKYPFGIRIYPRRFGTNVLESFFSLVRTVGGHNDKVAPQHMALAAHHFSHSRLFRARLEDMQDSYNVVLPEDLAAPVEENVGDGRVLQREE
ncbi:hypothetical protein AMAG_20196 [Allomyces macrogynus ATCC 38327]|uniref:Transposable element P transposase n=1 Tax=Allomyces macrogynus (strain ATCC 38327) TaxID=578462 RepID=A0A0L0T7T1_ALLM3|nr:hypothetical protein AMAG_20196 [Allomyces macrogynus ATCC 38327]|eukprot:KNE70868.1 hypothetical protein AMAG_20196 [Allomyces macrogynus ATCC 38327]